MNLRVIPVTEKLGTNRINTRRRIEHTEWLMIDVSKVNESVVRNHITHVMRCSGLFVYGCV